MGKKCFGVDIGGTAVKVGLFSSEGTLLNKWSFDTRKADDGKEILKDSAEFILRKIDELKLDRNEIVGIGVGIPGPVKDNGEVQELPNMGLGHFNIEEEMRGYTHLNIKAGNDANVAALGEYWQGGGKGYRSMVLITLGTGIGGGIIINGSILAGNNGAAGEIGHITVNEHETRTCGCGKKGCLEQYASATGIVRLAQEYIGKADKPSRLCDEKDITAKVVLDLAREGDWLALKVTDQAFRCLGMVTAHIAHVIDPEAFIIGGGVSKAGAILTEGVKKYYEENVMPALKNKEFRLATLGNDAGIYGSAKLVLSFFGDK